MLVFCGAATAFTPGLFPPCPSVELLARVSILNGPNGQDLDATVAGDDTGRPSAAAHWDPMPLSDAYLVMRGFQVCAAPLFFFPLRTLCPSHLAGFDPSLCSLPFVSPCVLAQIKGKCYQALRVYRRATRVYKTCSAFCSSQGITLTARAGDEGGIGGAIQSLLLESYYCIGLPPHWCHCKALIEARRGLCERGGELGTVARRLL